MRKATAFRPRPLIALAGLLLLLSACLPAAGQPLPTRLALVATLSPLAADSKDSTIHLSSLGSRLLPPVTWTPAPTPTSSRNDSRRALAPTAIPSPTPPLPSRTPLPPPATATRAVAPPPVDYVVTLPTIPSLAATDELGPSKLGIHVIRNNDPNIMAFVRQARPAVVKAVDDLGFLEEVKEVSPWTVTIGRVDDIYSQNYIGVPEEAARAYVERHLPTYQANPGVDYWEGWNEPDPNLDNMPWYARFEGERVRLMADYGLRTAVGGFATGVPELEEFWLFLPAIEAAKQYGGILTLHEYGAPDLTYLYGSPLPGQTAYLDRGALTFRYRWFYRDILEPMGLVIPLAITEAGVDGIIGNRPGPSGLGWKDFQSYWVHQGWATDGAQAFINQLAWYDAGVRQDGYVIGFTIFTAGGFGRWTSYDINPILPALADYVVGNK